MAFARKTLAVLMTALLAWTSIASGLFASPPTLARDHGARAPGGHSVLMQSVSMQHGAHHGAAGGGHAQTGLLPVDIAIDMAIDIAIDMAHAPQRSDRACVADCLDAIAAKLMPATRAAPSPSDEIGKAIQWPHTSQPALRTSTFAVTPPATGPPRQPLETAHGIARLVRANARLRI